jgi:hypothetical protein
VKSPSSEDATRIHSAYSDSSSEAVSNSRMKIKYQKLVGCISRAYP